MKQKIFPASVIVIAISFMLSAFATKPFAYLLSAVNAMTRLVKVNLEQSQAILQTKGKTSTTSSLYNISGLKSTVRLKISETVFQSYSDRVTRSFNPADYIYLYKLSIGKTNRSFTINTDGSTNAASMPVAFSIIDVLEYQRIIPTKGLVPGEYAFIDRSTTTAEGNITIWTFGVD